MVYVKVFFNNKCFRRLRLSDDEYIHRRVINACIVHAAKYRGYTFLQRDFFALLDEFSTLFPELSLRKVEIGKGYHYEYYYETSGYSLA